MAFVWKPAVYKGGVLTELPKPVKTLELDQSWDIRQSKIPLNDGIETDGHSKNGKIIFLAGQMGSVAGTNKITQEDMFALIASLETLFDVSAASDKFEFFIYHDTATATYRKFKNCSALRLKTGLGDDDHIIFQYSVEIVTDDPTIYSTSEGA